MYKDIEKKLEKPPLYEKSAAPFWDDEYISKQMLKAHLNPDFEGASRKLSFIELSASWISELVPATDYPLLLDVGCGPGIYAEKFTKAGYEVTGIDFSKRSIDYAQKSSAKKNLNITYFYQDYLHMDLHTPFDFAVMIYCDYGALPTTDRHIVMGNIYRHLKPGGKFLLDVFSMTAYDNFQEKQTWELCQDGGFWHQEEYLALNGFYKYPAHATLDQICVITNDQAVSYFLWNTYFSVDALTSEAEKAGFKVCGVYADVSGIPYVEDSPTTAILLEKPVN